MERSPVDIRRWPPGNPRVLCVRKGFESVSSQTGELLGKPVLKRIENLFKGTWEPTSKRTGGQEKASLP